VSPRPRSLIISSVADPDPGSDADRDQEWLKTGSGPTHNIFPRI